MEKMFISVGMGAQQEGFVKRLKELGFTIATFGKGKNSPVIAQIADFVAEIDTRDFASAVNWIDSLSGEVIAVGSVAGGVAIPMVQALSDYYCLNTRIPKEIMVGGSKDNRQMVMEKYDLSSIHTWNLWEMTDEIIDSPEYDSFIIKPVNGRGSEGISFLSKDELKARKKSANSEEKFIVQEIISGKEYRVVMFVQNGRIMMIAPLHRKPYRSTVFTGRLQYDEEHLEKITAYFTDFISKSGIKDSVIKSDIIVGEKRIDMIEMDIGSPGGVPFIKALSCIYGRDLMDDYINLVCGNKLEYIYPCFSDRIVSFIYNHSDKPVSYDEVTIKRELEKKYGECTVIINPLRPEKKGGYMTNADNLMLVVSKAEPADVDEFINNNLLLE